MAKKTWTREELILAINLYLKTPFGKIDRRNPEIIDLAKLLDRTPSAVAWKMSNFANIDPTLDRQGAAHYSKLDREIWNEFYNNWEKLIIESERLLLEYKNYNEDKEHLLPNLEQLSPLENTEVERTIKARLQQNLFRRLILSSYDYKCCITEINLPELLVASHIKPWSLDEKNRLNPSNGLCLNYLHDKAFDQGLITISEHYQVILSSAILKNSQSLQDYFQRYQGTPIKLPKRFLPSLEFLKYHREHIFKG